MGVTHDIECLIIESTYNKSLNELLTLATVLIELAILTSLIE